MLQEFEFTNGRGVKSLVKGYKFPPGEAATLGIHKGQGGLWEISHIPTSLTLNFSFASLSRAKDAVLALLAIDSFRSKDMGHYLILKQSGKLDAIKAKSQT